MRGPMGSLPWAYRLPAAASKAALKLPFFRLACATARSMQDVAAVPELRPSA
jgi:hypothetical protein